MSDEEVEGLRPVWMKKAAAWSVSITAVVTLLSQVVPPIYNLVLGDRIQKLEMNLLKCESETATLRAFSEATVKATENRIVDVEKSVLVLHGSQESLRNEVRIRSGDNPVEASRPRVVAGFGIGSGAVDEPEPRTRREKLRQVVQETDNLLENAPPVPPAKPLLQAVQEEVKEIAREGSNK